jgi:alpha-ketoglutarate-dependent taurine dioxygenase
MATICVESLTANIGAEVSGVSADQLLGDEAVAAEVLEALERHGVLALRGLDLDPASQVAFCERLGPGDYSGDNHTVPGIYRVTRDKSKSSTAEHLKGTFVWHIDGCTPLNGEAPQRATLLTSLTVDQSGGETEFASAYAAYEALSEEEKERFSSLKVLHSLEASQRKVWPDPTPEQVERWRARPTSVHPLVWTHRSGRKSLVLGVSADHVVGMDPAESRALLEGLLDRATAPEQIYRHSWSVGETVIWDNTGVMHRATPYPEDSPRELLRTTVFGVEHIS